jgi:hypothetical protein
MESHQKPGRAGTTKQRIKKAGNNYISRNIFSCLEGLTEPQKRNSCNLFFLTK